MSMIKRAAIAARDSLANLVSGLGTERDKAANVTFGLTVMTEQELLVFYRTSWVAKKIIRIPAFDATRAWRSWQADKEQIELIEAEEKRLGVQGKYLQAMIWSRLFGGAAIYIGTGDSDTSAPLDLERIKKGGVQFLTVIPKRSLTSGEIEQDPTEPYFGYPKLYTFTGSDIERKIHPSRLVIFRGEEIPDSAFGGYANPDGWGDSVLLAPRKDVTDAQGTSANIASLIYEAKVDVIKIKDLMAHLEDPEYEKLLLSRLRLAATAKGINGTLILDSEEEYEQKSASFQTLPQVMDSFWQVVCGAADIPVTRFMGQSPGGLQSTGESDLRNYYDRINADQNLILTPASFNLDEAIIRSALNDRPPEIHYKWSSLWQLSDKERAEIGKIGSETLKNLKDTELYPPEALAKAGITMMMEDGIMPSLQEQVDEAGGLPDYEAELQAEQEREDARLAAQAAEKQAVTDATPKTLYVRRDVLNWQEIAEFYRRQGLEITKPEKWHITIIHSRRPVDWFKVAPAWESHLTMPAGGARDHEFFGPPGLEDSLVLMVKSLELEWRNEAFRSAGAEMTYEEYQPHITLKYAREPFPNRDELIGLEPWSGEIKLGPELFEEVKSGAELAAAAGRG